MNKNQGPKEGKFRTVVVISALGRPRQKALKVDVTLGHTVRPGLKNPRRVGEGKKEREEEKGQEVKSRLSLSCFVC